MILFKNKTGQLANNLFEFATFISIAKENHHWLVNLSFSNNSKYFEGTKRFINTETKIVVSTFKLHRRFLHYFIQFIEFFKPKVLSANANVYDLSGYNWESKLIIKEGGWFIDFSNFYKHQDFIRAYFTPVPKLLNSINSFIETARGDSQILIGIHIRRGDYKTFLNGQFFFEIEDYIQKMREIEGLFQGKNIKFVIASNEIFKRNDFSDLNCVLAPNHFIKDMYVLSQCDYIFGPPSTYSMWASFYGKKPLLKFRTQDQQLKLEDFQLDYGY